MLTGVEAVDLARFQFAFTIAFHILFPSFTIGLASYLAVVEGLWLRTGKEYYLAIFNFWKTIFALTFGMGVVSGVVLSYQFGTNWSVFSDRAGPVIGPLMGYEVLTAFFLEAGFLGIMLFGLKRVGPRLHFVATVMVAIGTLISAFWILSVNSWMQTPAGFEIAPNGQFVPVDWWQVVFNPSFPYRLVHMILAAYLATAFAVGAVSAWHLLRGSRLASIRTMFSMAMWMALVVAPLQIFAGDQHGLNTLEHQPAKIAAMEGHYETRKGAPFIVFGWPDDERGAVRFALEIPFAGALILTHSLDGETKGLDEWPRDEWPRVFLVFWAFRIMLAVGFGMALIGLWSGLERWRGTFFQSRPLQRTVLLMGPSGFLAIIAGWVVTETGRQPWLIYGQLLTREGASAIDAPAVGASLAAFVLVYLSVFGAGLYYMLKLAARQPGDGMPESEEAEIALAQRQEFGAAGRD